MTGVLKTMSAKGHDVIPFDTETGEGIEKAIMEFNEKVARHGAAAFDTSTTPGERIKPGAYKPETMPDVTIVPAFAGG